MARPEPCILKVTNSVRITPNMHRITLGGDGLIDFPRDQCGGYIKLMLGKSKAGKPITRTYTIRNQSEFSIDVDFALHGTKEGSGPATQWALNTREGDMIKIGGPGPAKPLPEGNGPFLLIGDMTALPAISVNLEDLPKDATGHAIILIRNAADKEDMVKPSNLTIQWLVEEDLGETPALLADAVRKLSNIDDVSYAWAACEFEAMKLLRQYLRTEQQFGKERLYISSYWKRGLVEDDHKQIKRTDAETTA